MSIEPLSAELSYFPQGVVAREVAIMRELRHPNMLQLLSSFTAGQHIWMVSPYYSAGSLQSIVEYAYPQV